MSLRRLGLLTLTCGLNLALLVLVSAAAADTSTSLGDRSGEGSGQFTGLAQAPEANLFTGALATGIKIDVPAGRKNMTPSLTLQYSSAGGPGPFGYGWNLPIGRIERSTKWGVPNCRAHTDDFVLVLPTATVELVPESAGSNIFRPRIEEAYVKAERNPTGNYWTVTDRAGLKYTFGSADANFQGNGGADSARVANHTTTPLKFFSASPTCEFTSIWALTKIEDGSTNIVRNVWNKYDNVLYPKEILYGGNGQVSGPLYKVRFGSAANPVLAEDRPAGDWLTSYRDGVAAKVTKRITRITVESMVSEQPGVIRTYTLTYKDNPAGAGPDGYRSLLSRVSTEAQPTLDLVYKPSVNAHAATTTARPANAYGKMRVANSSQEVQQTVLDMNGDGILDVVRTDYYPAANKLWAVWFGTGNGVGFGTQTTWAVPFGGMPLRDVAGTSGNVNSDTFDITGDGIPDWVDAQAVPWKVYPGKLMSGQWKFDPTYFTWQNTPFLYLRANNTDGDTIQDLIDMNADGRPDLVYSKPGQGGPSSSWTWDVYYNTGTGFESTTPVLFSAPTRLITDVTSPAGCAAKHAVMDFNADGLPDLVNVGAPDATNGWPYDTRCSPSSSQLAFCLEVRHNTGQGFASTPHLMAIPPQVTSCGTLCFTPVLNLQAASCDTTTKTVLRDYFDVNGDGVPDWVSKDGSSSQWEVLLNLGSSFETLSYTSPVLPNIYAGEATRVWAGATGALRHYVDNDTAIDLMDFNGDGLLDQVDWGNGTTWTVRQNNPTATGVPAATTEPPNLLVTLQNGLGGTSHIFYKPSTAYDNTGTDTGSDGDLQPDLPFTTWVVDGIRRTSGQCTATVTNPLDPTNPCLGNGTTTFGHDVLAKVTYQDGRFDSAAREFRGFRQVTRRTIEGPTGGSNDTRTIFGQEDVTKGRVLSVHTYAGAATGDATQRVRLEENFWNTSALPNNRTKVWLAKNTRLTSDYPAAAQPHYVETVNDTVDTYGNITQHHTVGTDLTARVDTYIVYAVPQAGTLFPIYDRPARAWVQDASGVLEEKWFTYDGLAAAQIGAGNLTRMQSRRTPSDANGPVVTTVYDTYGNATSITDPNGNVTTQAYTDSAKLYPNVVTRVRPPPKQNLITTTVIDYFYGQPKMVTDPNGAISEYQYDQAGRKRCLKRPLDTDPCTIQYTYNLTPTPPPVGQPWPLASMRMRELQDVPKPELWTQHYFDGLGRPRYSDTFRVVDGLDQTVRSGQTDYDGGGRPARIQTAFVVGTTPDANDLTKFDYHLNGSATYIDPLGRAWRTTAVDGGVSEQQFAGVVTTAIDPEGTKTATTVDAFGRVTKTEVYQGAAVYMTTEYTYDGVGREKSVKLNGTTLKTVSYDSLGRKTSMTDVNTGSGTTAGTWSYNYDMNGNVIRQNDPKTNQQTQHCYNDLNQVTRDCPIASDTTTLVPCEITCGHPEEVNYFYDEVLESGSKALGRLTSVEDASGRTEFREYDLRGRVKKLKRIFNSGGSPHGDFATEYDLNDRVRWTKYPDGEIVNTDYDRSGQPMALWGTEVYVDTAEYDRFGRLKKLAHSNGVTDTRTYHTLAEGHRLKNVKSATASATYLNFDLADYNKRGQIKVVTDFRNGTGGLSLQGTYTYDFMGRLDYFQSNWPNATEDYAYDSFNRITLLGSRTFTYSATKPHQVNTIVDGGVSKTVTHDNNGNRSNKENTDYTYTYDVEDRPARVNAPNGDVDFIYDYTGQKRVESDSTNPMSVVTTRYYSALTATKTTGTGTPITYKWYYLGDVRVAAKTVMGAPWETTSLFDDFVRFAKVRAEQPALVVHLEGGAPIALGAVALGLAAALLLAPWRRREVIVGLRLRHGQVTGVTLVWLLATLPWPIILLPSAAGAQGASAVHFHLDHLGSTLAISGPGPAGSLQEEIRYRPYGDERWRMPSGGSFHGPDYEFTGYETQANIDLYYAKARFYDPVMGAFLTHDPAAQFSNPYTYTAWDPVNRTDPTGMYFTGTEWLIIAVIAMAAASAIDTLANGGSPLDALKAGLIAGATTAVSAGTLGPVLGGAIKAGGAAGVAAVSFIVASAGYGAYQAVESGYYASLITGIVLLAVGASRIRGDWGTAGAKPVGPQGANGPSTGDQLNFARQEFGVRFGGAFDAYDVSILGGFGDQDAAGAAALRRGNPQSISDNLEYGGYVYEQGGAYDYTLPQKGSPTGFQPSSAGHLVPEGASIVGDYHTHGDYSHMIGGKVVRTTAALDAFNSNHFSGRDLIGIRADAVGVPSYRGYLGTPSGVFRAYDPGPGRVYTIR